MPKIIFISPDGVRKEVEVETGYSIMEGAINHNIPGIVAECGGACACATCHSYIDEAWLDKIPPMDDMEDSTGVAVIPAAAVHDSGSISDYHLRLGTGRSPARPLPVNQEE